MIRGEEVLNRDTLVLGIGLNRGPCGRETLRGFRVALRPASVMRDRVRVTGLRAREILRCLPSEHGPPPAIQLGAARAALKRREPR